MDQYYDESHILESATPYTDAIRVSNETEGRCRKSLFDS